MRKTWLAAALLAVTGVASSAHAAFNTILSFGDSLSDTGNVAVFSGGTVPGPLYAPGRFSNGPIWLDGLAATFGVSSPVASIAGGTNYSFGGSRVAVANNFSGVNVPSFQSVVTGYLGTNPTISPNTLVTIWIGSNDYLSFDTNTNTTTMANAVQTAMNALAGRGARQFLVVNVPPVTQTPAVAPLPSAQKDLMNLSILDYNARLLTVAGNVAASVPGSKVYFLDAYAAYNAALANPAALGLTNTTSPALVGGTVAPNPNSYLWWDTVHPTATGHAFVGLGAARAIPEPAALGLVALAGLGLGRKRRGQG